MFKSFTPLARLLLTGAAALPLLSGIATDATAQTRLTDGIKAYWNFNDSNAADTAGGAIAYDGNPIGSPTYVDGKFGTSLQLNGTTDAVQIDGGEPDDLSFADGSMSLSVWFKTEGFDKDWQALVTKGENSNWRVARRGSEQGMAYVGGNGGDTPTGPFNAVVGQWHHLVAIADKDNSKVSLWIDGVLNASRDGAVALTKNGKRMLIGDNADARGRNWKGGVDDLAVWERALTETEVAALWNGGAGREIKTFFVPQIEILGVGAASLLGGDLTDPENDGKDALGAANDPSWNWVSITSSVESDFEGGENAFNIFDNKVGGGNDKWCCDDPTTDKPVWVAVQFPNPVALTHFTVTSGNDSPDRDPTDWAIQGSDDGATYADIYHMTPATDPVVPWTARNQVVKFTLPFAATPYRYIRYIAYVTPGTLHQLNEIEYFGTVGGSALAFVSGINSGIDTFSFRTTDTATSVVDPASVKLSLDGASIPLGALTKVDGVIAASYTSATPFLPNSPHTYSITAKDGFGNNVTANGSFKTAQYALLPPEVAVTPDTSKPGFIWDVTQNNDFQANDNNRPVDQLAGKLGQNYADPNNQSVANGPGVPLSDDPNSPIRFEIEGVLNLSQGTADNNGNFKPDSQFPGIPGVGDKGGNNGIAARITTYVALPKGATKFIVNSDDGFRTTAGVVDDVFQRQLAGEFAGGRGASDTEFTIYALQAGVYAVSTVWEEGGGGANIELVTRKSDGTLVLLNDVENGGLPAYREAVGGGNTVISSVTPVPNQTDASFASPIEVTTIDGADAVDAASVKLTLDGAPLAGTATKTGGKTTISIKPAGYFAPLSTHTATVSYKAGTKTRSETWTFKVIDYPTLTKAQQAISVDKTATGFNWNIFENGSFTHTTLAQTEQALAGLLSATVGGELLPNLADPTKVSVALGEGAPGAHGLVHFEVPGVINMSQTGGDNNGNFPTDDQFPGIPGTDGLNNGIDAEIITFIDLPAGPVTLVVNSDDGFRTQAGYINVPADGVILGQFEGGRGASDTRMTFLVQDAGIYPVRTIWQEGGGGANIEIFSVKADGSKALVNDTANGGLPAYRVGVAPNKPSVNPALSVVANTDGTVTVTFEGVLETADKPEGPYTPQTGAVSPLKVAVDRVARFARARK